MLVLAAVEVIYFIIVGMGLCFRFMLKTVLIIQGCFCYWWAELAQSRPFLLLIQPSQQRGWGCTRNWVDIQPGETTTDPRDIPYSVTWCWTYKASWTPACLWKRMKFHVLLLLVHSAFDLPIKLSLSQPTGSLISVVAASKMCSILV